MAGRLKPEEILLCGNRPEHAILLKLTAIVGSSGAAGMGRGAEALIEAEQKANATGSSAWGDSSGDWGDAFSSAGAGNSDAGGQSSLARAMGDVDAGDARVPRCSGQSISIR